MGEKVKLVSGREGGVGRRGLRGGESSGGSKGGGGKRGGGRGVVVGLALAWLLVKGLGPGFGSIPARNRRVATNERGREEERKRRGAGG